jgi:predicted phosphodiesterase
MTRVGIIGDIHGHATEMVEMIALLEDHGIDQLVLLGDLVDRGPEPLRCLRIAQTWEFEARDGALKKYDVIRGNHEDAYWRIAKKVPKPGRSHVEQPESRSLYARLSADDLNWMENLPVYLEIPELRLVCLHGGITPHDDTLESAGEFVLRTRYLDENYYPCRGISGSTFWAEVYDGRFGTIVFGHESHREIARYTNAIAIDGEGFRKVHGIVVSNEPGDELIETFTVPYGQMPIQSDLSYDPDRVHTFDATFFDDLREDVKQKLWLDL